MSISVHSRLVSGKARKHPRLLTAMVFPALLLVSAFAAGSPVQAEIAYVPVRVVASSGATATVTFTPPSVGNLSGATKEITVGVDTTFVFNLGGDTRISHRVQRTNGAAAASFRRGNISLMLPSELYKNAAVSLYAINGRRVFNSKVASTSSTAGSLNRPLNNIPAGVYLLSVKSDNGNSFSSRLSHSGGKLNLNVAFTGGAFSFDKLAKQTAANNEWTISATSASFSSQAPSSKVLITGGNNPTIYIKFANSNFGMGGSTIEVSPSRLPDVETVPPKALPNPAASYTETAGGQSFDMVYISGGTFTLGCSGSGCPPDTRAVEDVTVSPYYIAKTTVNSNLWNAVMGGGASSFMGPQITWYDAMVFACRLSKMTGRNYRMQTEAEFEYAVKKHKSSLTISASTEEWAYNSWSGTHSGGTDPVGPGSGQHTQKTRRNATGYADTVGRLIRSIEGIGPALRLVISANGSFPTEYVAPCNIHAPEMDREPVNSYRDMRWVTGGDSAWAAVTGGQQSAGSFDIRLWEDGTASMAASFGSTRTSGQWFTSNNISLVFVPNSGTARRYPYVMVDASHASLLSEQNFMNGGFIGRIEKRAATNVPKPTVTLATSAKALAESMPNFSTDYKMVDMVNIPAADRKQDPRLIDGVNNGWFQNNSSAGGLHHYRKDVDADEFRFTVNQGNQTMLANGTWFTVNNTFLRVRHSEGYTVEYLYTASDSTFYHNSFMGYERGDFRMFTKVSNSSYSFPGSCGSHCNQEIPKGAAASMYGGTTFPMRVGLSTFVPAPCPASGCN